MHAGLNMLSSPLVFAIMVAAIAAITPATLQLADQYANTGSTEKNVISTTLSALLAFKQAISSDSTHFLAPWNVSMESNYCNWRGVQCANGTHNVIALLLDSNQLYGILPPQLQHLSALSYLNVSNNSFHGHVPYELGELSSLTHLDLSLNQLTGTIPSTLANCTHLQFLDLRGNVFSGKFPSFLTGSTNLIYLDLSKNSFTGERLPPDIGHLSKLQFLQLYHCGMSGGLPPSITNCTSLVWLHLHDNGFTGPLPSEWSKLSSILDIYFQDNFFSGSIPATLGNCTTLRQLGLSNNSFTGELPAALGKLVLLQYLTVFQNSISGAIPTSLVNCSALLSLQLFANKLTGPIPSRIGHLKQALQLSFSSNAELSGQIPATIGDCTQLQYLSIRFTEIGGPIPTSIYNLSNLQILRLSSSRFFGTLSEDVKKLTALTSLYLDSNAFVGRLPTGLTELAQLQGLDLHNNSFQGPLPQRWPHSNSISLMDLSYNLLSGGIPSALGHLHLLDSLQLHNNRFSGDIPDVFQSLTRLLNLDFSHNRLSGRIPQSLSVSESLNLSFNNLTGWIPPSMGNMLMVTTIDLARNHLTGQIPDTLAGCQSLETLDLSENNLGGEIPSTFGQQLVVLQYLDLSHNNLHGALPPSLGDLSHLVTLNVSFNSLQGRIPSIGVYNRSPAAAFMGNPELCGYPLDRSGCPSHSHHWPRSGTAVLIVSISAIGGVLMILVCLCFCWWCSLPSYLPCRNRNLLDESEEEWLGMQNLVEVRAWTARELRAATNGFDKANLIGSGGTSMCFKGMVDEGRGRNKTVAIKRLDMGPENQSREAKRRLVRELKTLCKVKHRNLVCTLGYCIDEGVVALVLQFMEKGGLDEHLHSESQSLSWEERLSIAADVAEGLVYLHHEFFQPIIHCDLKPANILLGSDMVARIADFGITKFVDCNQSTAEQSSSNFRGTFGYAAPECAAGSRISTKADVYSYGVLLIELVTGMKPTSPQLQERGMMNVHTWARGVLKSAALHTKANLADTALQQNMEKDPAILPQLEKLLDLGAKCTNENPHARPNMKYVRETLASFTHP